MPACGEHWRGNMAHLLEVFSGMKSYPCHHCKKSCPLRIGSMVTEGQALVGQGSLVAHDVPKGGHFGCGQRLALSDAQLI
jgi:hypothetical protein